MKWLRWISPEIDGSIGTRHFPFGVINPWRILYDFELFMFTDGGAAFVVGDEEFDCFDGSYLIVPPRAATHLARRFAGWRHRPLGPFPLGVRSNQPSSRGRACASTRE